MSNEHPEQPHADVNDSAVPMPVDRATFQAEHDALRAQSRSTPC
jgi:hypothetical protein